MKNGKLFGKLNIIDFLVILVIVAAAVFVALRLTGRGPSDTPVGTTGTRIRYEVKVPRMEPELYEAIKARIDGGETQFLTGEALIDARIVGIRTAPYVTTVATEDGRLVLAEDPYFLNVYFTYEAGLTSVINNQVVTQEIRIGSSTWVKTVGFQFTGTVVNLEILN